MKSKMKVQALVKLAKLTSQKFKQVVKDGVTYEYDVLEEGADIWFEDENGVTSVPPNGVYEIEGKSVTVANGIMTTIEEKVEEPTTDTPAEVPLAEDLVAKLEERVAKLEAMVEEMKTSKEEVEEMKKVKEEFSAIVEKLSKPLVTSEKESAFKGSSVTEDVKKKFNITL